MSPSRTKDECADVVADILITLSTYARGFSLETIQNIRMHQTQRKRYKPQRGIQPSFLKSNKNRNIF